MTAACTWAETASNGDALWWWYWCRFPCAFEKNANPPGREATGDEDETAALEEEADEEKGEQDEEDEDEEEEQGENALIAAASAFTISMLKRKKSGPVSSLSRRSSSASADGSWGNAAAWCNEEASPEGPSGDPTETPVAAKGTRAAHGMALRGEG